MAVEQDQAANQATTESYSSRTSPYDRWVASTGLPVHEGYFIPDVRTVKLAPWQEREGDSAFLKLAGQEGFTEARVSEIPPGATLPPLKFGFDEAVYVIEGRGLTTISTGDGTQRSFEWQKHSLFLLPRHCTHQFSNSVGNRPARLLHFNYLPLAMAATPEPAFHFDNPFSDPSVLGDEQLYSSAKVTPGALSGGMSLWSGN